MHLGKTEQVNIVLFDFFLSLVTWIYLELVLVYRTETILGDEVAYFTCHLSFLRTLTLLRRFNVETTSSLRYGLCNVICVQGRRKYRSA